MATRLSQAGPTANTQMNPLLQLNEKELCVRNLDLADFLPAEWLVLHQVLYKIVVHLGVRLNTGLSGKVTVDKLLNRNVLA